MSAPSFHRPGECLCQPIPDGEPRGVMVRIDGYPGNAEYDVSVTCAACGRPVWIEGGAEVTAEDVPMAMTRTVDSDGNVSYELAEVPS